MDNRLYTEVAGEKPFDWNKALSRPVITEADWSQMASLSGSWVTCACGNQCAVIPRDDDGSPVDARLSGLGIRFDMAIRNEDRYDALDILERIEARSTELINRINGK